MYTNTSNNNKANSNYMNRVGIYSERPKTGMSASHGFNSRVSQDGQINAPQFRNYTG